MGQFKSVSASQEPIDSNDRCYMMQVTEFDIKQEYLIYKQKLT